MKTITISKEALSLAGSALEADAINLRDKIIPGPIGQNMGISWNLKAILRRQIAALEEIKAALDAAAEDEDHRIAKPLESLEG